MHFTKKTVSDKRSDLIKNLKSKKLLRFPGAYNPLCAKLIAEIGYDGVQMGTRFIATDECTTPQDYKDAIVNASEEDITWTTKLTGVPIAIIDGKGVKQHNNWLVRRLLNSRFKHRTRALITGISFFRMRSLARGKKKSAKDLWSAGKSVETVHSIESATVIMSRLGESLNSNPNLKDRSD